LIFQRVAVSGVHGKRLWAHIGIQSTQRTYRQYKICKRNESDIQNIAWSCVRYTIDATLCVEYSENLHIYGYRDKGVKVDLGIPYELWDKPSVEITTLKTQCEGLLEYHETDIEDWYYKYQGKIPLIRYFKIYLL